MPVADHTPISYALGAVVHPSATAGSVSFAGLLLQLVVGLGVVLGIIWVATRVMRGRVRGSSASRRAGAISVVARQSLGKGVSLAVVRVGDRPFLVGATPHSVHKIEELDPGDLAGHSVEPAPDDDLPRLDRGSAQISSLVARRNRSEPNWLAAVEQLREMTVRRT